MSITAWLRRRLSLVVTAVSAVVVSALVITVAIVSGGYTAQRVDLGDAAVWVSNVAQQYVGRANTAIHELNSAVAVAGASREIAQRGRSVVAVDVADARADIIDPVTSTVEKTVALPPDQPAVYLAGDEVAVYSSGTGELWVVPFAAFPTFDADQEATLNLGAGTVVSVDDAGLLTAYTPSSGQVRTVDLASGVPTTRLRASGVPLTGTGISVTSVGSHWAVLDDSTLRLEVDGHGVELSTLVPAGDVPVLQQASAGGSGVLVGYSGGLLRVPFDGGPAASVVDGHAGTPAAPIVFEGCEYAAWSDGSGVRLCADPGRTDSALAFAGMGSASGLVFRTNGSSVVLNDSGSGASWAVGDRGQSIDNWDALIARDTENQQSGADDPNAEPVIEKAQKPPVAVRDDFGARPGRTSVLPVLLNDYDPNGDVLAIDAVTAIDPRVGTLDIVSQRQQVQITLLAGATGSVDFSYTISDGRGGTASAHVSVSVHGASVDSPPRQARTTRVTVPAGGHETAATLADWYDPDGDPFYLASASVDRPDSVSYGPEGNVTVTAAASSSGREAVALVVSDGTEEASGTLSVTVDAPRDVPLVADPFVVLAQAGQEVTVSPLDHVHGGIGAAKLGAVPSRVGSTIVPSYQAGTFLFTSSEVRTHYLSYTVTDGVSTVTGTVRIDVSAPADVNSTPITVPQTVFVHTLSSASVDVASTDIDPAGGVLLLTDVDRIPSTTPVLAEILAQSSVRVTLTGILHAPASFGYTITNGLAEAHGTITVVQVPLPAVPQPPIARDDTATARVGDAIDIDVLANDEQPDGLGLALEPQLVQGVGADSGLAFVSGQRLRYLAPDHPGNFTVVYEVKGPAGQSAQAQVRIQVREAKPATNDPPAPITVIARVFAGDTVRIDIPLAGIDPDGDSVQFLGQTTNPAKGAVTAAGTSWLEYTAGDYSAGTDSFEYAVSDALGARATGTVRIGVAPRAGGAHNPVATRDDVTVRPGTTVSVQVLENDSDPDGGTLRVVSAQPSAGGTAAAVVGTDIVQITPPTAPGTYSVVYTIQNASGGTSSAFVTVTVDPDAPLSYPIASDSVLTLSDILGRDRVDVDVLSRVFFADGDPRSLGLTLLPGYGGTATVTSDKHVLVQVTDDSQIIPFQVTHPDDPSVRSFALIWVPGRDSAVPQLKTDAPALVVTAGQPLTIRLADHVVAAAGKSVRLADRSTVQATHADGSPLVVDDETLRFESAPGYTGPASISFEVTDGSSPNDPNGRRAVIVLPITVQAAADAPPVFRGAVLEVEPAQSRTIDLARLTQYARMTSSLFYSVVPPAAQGFSYRLTGSSLTVTAAANTAIGSTGTLTIAVRDPAGAGTPGRISLEVVSSTRPLVQPLADVVQVRRGTTTVVDVLANDEATNPFPGRPLRVVAIGGLDGGALPAGVQIQPVDSGRRLSVTVAPTAAPVNTNLQYEVEDATGDAARAAFGTVRISVQDAPDAPQPPAQQSSPFVGGQLTLRLTPAAQNNSTITSYLVRSTDGGGYSHDCGLSLVCTLADLQVGVQYRFTVVAVNAIGPSRPSGASDAYAVDYLPAAPASVSAEPSAESVAPSGRSITVTWSAVPDPSPGTAVSDYVVTITGSGVSFSTTATSPFTTTAAGQLVNDASYTVSVYARNAAAVTSSADWRRTTTSVHTVGPPSVPSSGPTAVTTSAGDVLVTWGDADSGGSGSVRYSVARLPSGSSTPSCSSGPGKPGVVATDVTSGWTDTTAGNGTYVYAVYVDNGIYCTAATSGPVEAKRPPGQASGTVALPATSNATGQFDLIAGGLTASGTVDHFEFRLDGGAWAAVSDGAALTSIADASHYGVATSVTYRACRDSGQSLCGPVSDAVVATPVDARAHVASCVPGTAPLFTAPQNAGSPAVAYQAAYEQPDTLGSPTWGSFQDYHDGDTVPSDATGARLRATVTMGGADFVDAGYDEVVCG